MHMLRFARSSTYATALLPKTHRLSLKYRNCTIIIRLATYIIISGQALDFMRKLKIIQQKDERFFCFCYFYLLSCIFIVAACQTFTAWFYSCVRWQLHAWHEPAQRRLSERAHFARPDAV